MIPTGQEEGGEDQEIIHNSQLTTDSSRRITLMIRQRSVLSARLSGRTYVE